MTVRAAGIMMVTPDGEALFLKRGPGGDHPGEWCWPGGTTEGDEAAEETAVRETIEELGFLPDGTRSLWTRQIANNEIAGVAGQAINPPLPPTDAIVVPAAPVDYTTFIQRVPARFEPKLNGEHEGFAWSKVTAPPEPLHPGARIALARLAMNELDIARAMAAGDLTSPQKYENVWLFAIRITGTGLAYRRSLDEHVWRDPSLYLNDEFLARCNGLAVIWVHPAKATLNSKEYADRSIGSILLPYIQADEVWGIAKVYDEDAATEMSKEQLSTSPTVVFRDPSVNRNIEEDGKKILIEGKPSLLDHVAIVPLGVWDKSGPPTGVLNHSLTERADQMAETEDEKKAREDAARKDAENEGKLDKLLAGLGNLADSMGGLSKRMDAMEMTDKARRDSEDERERADASRRRDAEHDTWMKSDAAQCAKDDAEEEGEREKFEKAGEDKEAAAEKARKDRRDRMDARRKDAAEVSAKADSQAAVDRAVAEALTKLNLPKSHNDTDHGEMADHQARSDAVYSAFGLRAPGPLQGESLRGFRTRLAKPLQTHSKAWSGIDLAALPDDAFTIAETAIRADAASAARSPDDVPLGQLREIKKTDGTGRVISEFVGDPSAWMGQFRTRPRVLVKPLFRRNSNQGA